MDSAAHRDRRLFDLSGLDWNDDDAIDAWCVRVWGDVTKEWRSPMTQNEATVLTDRFTAAVAYATAIHATQRRKGTNVPYIAHLLGVASLVLEAGGTEDEAIAGLLHDAVEDAGGLPRLADVRVRFGDDVADIVLACSDSTDEEWKRSVDYSVRKNLYLEHLKDTQSRAVMVSMADKVHNARSIVTDLQRDGAEVLTKFNGKPDQILSYYRTCLSIGESKGVSEAVLTPLRTAINQMTDLLT